MAFVLKPFKDNINACSRVTATLGHIITVTRLLRKMADFLENHILILEVVALVERLQMNFGLPDVLV